MNLNSLWVESMSGHGFDTIHWSTVGESTAPETQIIEFAAANGYTVFTHDLDFGMLLAAHKSTAPSVLQLRSQDVLPATIGEAIIRAIGTAQSHLESGALVTVDPIGQRIRLLPI